MRDEVIFGAAAKDYTALGLRVVPTGGEDGKRPLIRRWQSVGLRAVDELADRYPCANIGLIDGDRGGITRVDVDDSALEDTAIERFGDTPVVVGTNGGTIAGRCSVPRAASFPSCRRSSPTAAALNTQRGMVGASA